jgi:hypothetical protein
MVFKLFLHKIDGSQPSDSLICLDQDSLSYQKAEEKVELSYPPSGHCTLAGTLVLFNTKKAFLEDLDRRQLLLDFAQSVDLQIKRVQHTIFPVMGDDHDEKVARTAKFAQFFLSNRLRRE